ncbi:hypothetical protein WISP_51983 [Willisornis vidua]|uniref:CCHC-type domain-containing protein n=1 Tax=Willisornis vidua TaxID=1566151 RepID=A0ABQ9DJN6_9PASS|nr:hypothetical protein WISP_51983 [Willisornis vidua]
MWAPAKESEEAPKPLQPGKSGAPSSSATGKLRPERWFGVVQDAVLEGEWTEASSIVCPIVRDIHGAQQYEQHEWKTLQEAKKTLREGGLNTESGRAFLDWLYTAETNCPYDCQNITKYLLTPSQQIIWEKEWRRLAQLEAARPRPAGDPLAGLTHKILVDGAFEDVQIQLQYPIEVHHITARLARQAYYAVPEPTPVPSFTAVNQGVTEPYQHFIDRLHQSIAAQSGLSSDEKMPMFRLFAFENANTKSLLASFPKTADVSEMLEVADRASQHNQTQAMAGAFAAAMRSTKKLLATVAQKLSQPGHSQDLSADPVCYKCGAKGHIRRTCTATVWCHRCQRDTHDTIVCGSTKNGKGSSKGHRAKTQKVPQLPAPTTCGSLAFNVVAVTDFTQPNQRAEEVPTGIKVPIFLGINPAGALLIGQSSAGMAGLVVLPGVVNADHTGDVMLTCYTITPPIVIKKGTHIAQLIFFPTKDTGIGLSTSKDAQSPGFPSSPIVCLVQQIKTQPVITVLLTSGSDTRVFSMGADVTNISPDSWPKHWKLVPALDAVQGVGGGSNPQQSAQPMQLKFPEGPTVTLRPHVMPLLGQLGGLICRDVMRQLGAVLSVPEPTQNS